ncbi:uncharacterized protein LOC132057880 [Lycium ferocissimum]|uniref:uncharacterized protein LOC132057880 n=1 Tax=Lycium ferocissimum TaxID=112874 RepID=UPI0028162BC3|nr:uncharacterized protein LOC132057880 [Lycium ferocissimum]
MEGVGKYPYLMDSIGLWNTRGLNRPEKQKEMNLFLHNSKTGLFGLLETKVKRAKAHDATLNLCNGWSFSTNLVQHPGGRIWLLWKPGIYVVNILYVTSQMIHCEDLKSSGSFYTWNNKQKEGHRVYSRIDRVLINGEWILKLPDSEVHFGTQGLYDHCPAIITWAGTPKVTPRFKYFNIWSSAPNFEVRIQNNWEKPIKGTKMYQLVGRLNRLKTTLRAINKERFNEEEIRCAKEAKRWSWARNKFLQQKYKCQWLKEGDMNTKFYQQMLKARISTNKIFNIIDTADTQRCGAVVKQGPVVTNEQRQGLEKQVTKQEIKQALWGISGDKAPGIDGYESQFFKDAWKVVHTEVEDAVLEFFKNGKMLRVWNRAVVTLIPKSDHAAGVGDYRPIACCNITYKIV